MIRLTLWAVAVAIACVVATSVYAAPSGRPATHLAQLSPQLFATSYLNTGPDGEKSIVTYRWVEPAKAYDVTFEPQWGSSTVTHWTIWPDGSLSGKGVSSEFSGTVDANGFPDLRFSAQGKQFRGQLVARGSDLNDVLSQNDAPAGQPEHWTEVRRSERRPINMGELSILRSQWKQQGPAPASQNVPLRPTAAEDAATLQRHLAAIAAGQPLYKEMNPQPAAVIHNDPSKWQDMVRQFGPVSFVRFVGVDANGVGSFMADHAYAGVVWKVQFDQQNNLSSIGYEQKEKRNEFRKDSGKHSFGNPTLDDLPLDRKIFAYLEPTDGKTTGRGWRVDCYRVRAPVGTNMRLSVYTGGVQTFARLVNGCDDWERRSWVENEITTSDFGIRFSMPEPEIFVVVHGDAPGRPYQVLLNQLTPAEVAQWQEDIRKDQLAQQRREQERANEPSMLDAMVRGAAIGLSGINAPLMPNEGNTLDILNQAGAAVARQNAINQAQLNATIAQAQQQQPNSGLPAATASPAPPSAGSPTQAHSARGPKTFRAYFDTSYVNPDDADHNTFCQSNIFSFTVPAWSSDTAGDDIDAVLGPMKSTFAQKCVEAAGRPLAANPMYEVEIYGRVLELKPLRAGDHQVTMP